MAVVRSGRYPGGGTPRPSRTRFPAERYGSTLGGSIERMWRSYRRSLDQRHEQKSTPATTGGHHSAPGVRFAVAIYFVLRWFHSACHLALNAARSTSCPRRKILLIRRELPMLSRGFASRIMKSALLPGATIPELTRATSAESRVAATIASAGDMPIATRLSKSKWLK